MSRTPRVTRPRASSIDRTSPLMSESTRMVRSPWPARLVATFSVVVVLPTPRLGPKTPTTMPSLPVRARGTRRGASDRAGGDEVTGELCDAVAVGGDDPDEVAEVGRGAVRVAGTGVAVGDGATGRTGRELRALDAP